MPASDLKILQDGNATTLSFLCQNGHYSWAELAPAEVGEQLEFFDFLVNRAHFRSIDDNPVWEHQCQWCKEPGKHCVQGELVLYEAASPGQYDYVEYYCLSAGCNQPRVHLVNDEEAERFIHALKFYQVWVEEWVPLSPLHLQDPVVMEQLLSNNSLSQQIRAWQTTQ